LPLESTKAIVLPRASFNGVYDPVESAREKISSMPPLIRLAVAEDPESSRTAFAPPKRNDVFWRFFVRRPKPSYCGLTPFNAATWFLAFHVNTFAPSDSMLPFRS
jgi:hypothetical protein